MFNQSVKVSVCVLAAATFVFSCSPQTTSKEKETIRNKNSEQVSDSGGEVGIDDGSKITVPPGAVAVGTEVSVQKVADDPAFEVGAESASSTVEIKGTGADGAPIEQAAQPMTVALSIDNGAGLHLDGSGFDLTGNADDMCVLLKTASGKQMVWRRALLTIDEAAKKVSLQSLYFGKYKAIYCGMNQIAGFEEAADTGATGAPQIEVSMTVPADFAPKIARGKYCFGVVRESADESHLLIAVSETASAAGDTVLKAGVNSASLSGEFKYFVGVSFQLANTSCVFAVGKTLEETGLGDTNAFYAFEADVASLKSGHSGKLGAGAPYALTSLKMRVGGEGNFASLPAHAEPLICVEGDGDSGVAKIRASIASDGKIFGEAEPEFLVPEGIDRAEVRFGEGCGLGDFDHTKVDLTKGKPYAIKRPYTPGDTFVITPINLKVTQTTSLAAGALGVSAGCVNVSTPGSTSDLGQLLVSFQNTSTPYGAYIPYIADSTGAANYSFHVGAFVDGNCDTKKLGLPAATKPLAKDISI